eukprot:1142264-Pelagomonas_calceolata.AAC.2
MDSSITVKQVFIGIGFEKDSSVLKCGCLGCACPAYSLQLPVSWPTQQRKVSKNEQIRASHFSRHCGCGQTCAHDG